MESLMSHKELVNKLLELDREVSLLYEKDERLYCVIVGGSALILLGCITRATHDIDVIKCSNKIKNLLGHYGFNERVQTYINNFPYDFEDRFVKLDIPTKRVDFYTAGLEDVVVAKLHSFRDSDWADVTYSDLVAKIDWELLHKCAKEAEKSALNDRSYKEFLLRFEDYVRRFKPCGD